MPWIQSVNRIWCLAKFELVRLFLTKRGGLALAAFATAWFLILYYAISSAATIVSDDNFRNVAVQITGAVGLSKLLDWPVSELAVYWLMAIYLFPMFTLLAASDQTCADRTRGTLRFIALRASRTEIVVGRFGGQVIIMALLIALTLLATLAMAAYRDGSLLLAGVPKSIYIFANLLLAVMPFIALMSFFNAFIRSSRLAVVASMLFFGLLPVIIMFVEFKLGFSTQLTNIFPGVQLNDIVSQRRITTFHYLLPIVQTLGYIVIADVIMKRSSL